MRPENRGRESWPRWLLLGDHSNRVQAEPSRGSLAAPGGALKTRWHAVRGVVSRSVMWFLGLTAGCWPSWVAVIGLSQPADLWQGLRHFSHGVVRSSCGRAAGLIRRSVKAAGCGRAQGLAVFPGRMPTTEALRVMSLLRRFTGVVLCSFTRCAAVKLMGAITSGWAIFMHAPGVTR